MNVKEALENSIGKGFVKSVIIMQRVSTQNEDAQLFGFCANRRLVRIADRIEDVDGDILNKEVEPYFQCDPFFGEFMIFTIEQDEEDVWCSLGGKCPYPGDFEYGNGDGCPYGKYENSDRYEKHVGKPMKIIDGWCKHAAR